MAIFLLFSAESKSNYIIIGILQKFSIDRFQNLFFLFFRHHFLRESKYKNFINKKFDEYSVEPRKVKDENKNIWSYFHLKNLQQTGWDYTTVKQLNKIHLPEVDVEIETNLSYEIDVPRGGEGKKKKVSKRGKLGEKKGEEVSKILRDPAILVEKENVTP